MEAIDSRYIPINYAELPEGINIIEAHQGAGKTERINDLIGQSTIVVGSKRELGKQLIERCPELYFAHYEDLPNDQLHKHTNLFICYPSLHRLLDKDLTKHNFNNLVIDEANNVWESSYKWLPRLSNNDMFHRLIRVIPRVIVVGASIKDYILKDLENIKQPQWVITE